MGKGGNEAQERCPRRISLLICSFFPSGTSFSHEKREKGRERGGVKLRKYRERDTPALTDLLFFPFAEGKKRRKKKKERRGGGRGRGVEDGAGTPDILVAVVRLRFLQSPPSLYLSQKKKGKKKKREKNKEKKKVVRGRHSASHRHSIGHESPQLLHNHLPLLLHPSSKKREKEEEKKREGGKEEKIREEKKETGREKQGEPAVPYGQLLSYH